MSAAPGSPWRLWADARGAVPIEFVAGVALLVLPVAMLVAVFPAWAERQSMARLAAAEAAREAVRADDVAAGIASAEQLAARIAANHGVAPDEFTVTVDLPVDPASGRPARGAMVVVTARVQIPLVAVPLVGQAGGFSWTVTHQARIDDYRSLSPP